MFWSKKKNKNKANKKNLYYCNCCLDLFEKEELSMCPSCEERFCVKCLDPIKHDCPDTNFELGMRINEIRDNKSNTRDRVGIEIFNKAIENAALEIEDCIKDFDDIMEEQLGLKTAKSKATFVKFSRMLLAASAKRIRYLKRD